ncbi:S9 family peptidase [Pseudidiomarina mangrovi]|uniref:S9 family peptidase n=1 Tax=Pseudidiomarina mangrovi TaxID=2487133 RepID=UPI000FCA91A0|nr:S9 family peptidase [Pseudidiomarina mangrovi]
MRFTHYLTGLLIGLLMVHSAHAELTIERIFSAPNLTTAAPQQLQFSPAGTVVSYLAGSAEQPQVYDLWLYDVRANQHRRLVSAEQLVANPVRLSAEEQARRERLRIRASGIVDYSWSPSGDAILFPLNGQLFLYQLSDNSVKQLTVATMSATDARFSPQGTYVSFVHDHNLWVIERASGSVRALTRDGTATVHYATAEFIAQEEMQRMSGYWWSPDEQHIALTKVDLNPVAVMSRTDIHADRTEVVQQRYPAAGAANAVVDLGILSLDNNSPNSSIRWLQLPTQHGNGYLARVNWVTDSSRLSYQWQNRSQSELTLYLHAINAQRSQALLRESSDSWINLHDDLTFLADARHFIWSSERSGFKHLYLYRLDGSLIRQLTSGDWQVDALARVDETAGYVYFTGRYNSPIERHLYRTSLTTSNPSQPTQLSSQPGMHQVVFASDARSYINYFSSPQQPPQVSLHGPSGERIAWLHENKIDNTHPLAEYLSSWRYPEFGTLNAADGQVLHYQLTKPVNFADNRRYPAVVLVYGGPRAQRVTRSWGDYFAQYLAQQGFVVFQLDNRGSGNRGKQFERPIFRQLGQVEVTDQQLGLQFLQKLPYVNAERIGVFGHSYGGYMALHMVLRLPEVASAVAGAPVTDWALYDTHYTERYLGTPQDNAEGYQRASVLSYAKQLSKPLLIYHGMADDNVLFDHTAKLTFALQDAMLPFEMMAYPGKAHGLYGRSTSIHRYQMIADFFVRTLK